MATTTLPAPIAFQISADDATNEISFASSDSYNIPQPTLVFKLVLRKDEDGRVVVTSPDLPGMVTDGADEKEATLNAFDAVQALLETRGIKKAFNLIITSSPSA